MDNCPKTFAVRSNARRHLKTHGINVGSSSSSKQGGGRSDSRERSQQPYLVGFEAPVVVNVHDFGRTYVDAATSRPGASGSGSSRGRARAEATEKGQKAQRLRWVPPSLANRSNAGRLRSLSPGSDMADVDADGDIDPDGDPGESDDSHEFNAHAVAHRGRAPAGGRTVRVAPAPLPPVSPSEPSDDVYAKFEERNSFAESSTYPYHAEQVIYNY